MRKLLSFIVLLPLLIVNLRGQEVQLHVENGSENDINNATNPCITSEQYIDIERRCNFNSKMLNELLISPENEMGSIVLLDWPLRASADLHDCSYYNISAYVDQDTIVGSIRDFNCGTNTYDGHKGTDISIWPFNFYKMDNSLVEIVAAASGTILDKHDGEFDRNCTGNNLTANYVVIEHSDGSRTLYWHMKNGAVTTKAIGQSVVAGEYLGVVGSSGSSSGPHLHFEIWSGNNNTTRKDPYGGSCNTLNAQSWWISQKPYKEPGIIRATVHTTDALVPGCPATETPNDTNFFMVPFQGPGLPAGYAKFYIFIRNEMSATMGNMSILNPNGSTYLSWTYNSTAVSRTKMWSWSKVLPTIPGIYTFTATYNGVTCSSDFEIATTVTLDEVSNGRIKVYPNPVYDNLFLKFNERNNRVIEIYDAAGRVVGKLMDSNVLVRMTLDLENGLYYYRVNSANDSQLSGRFIVYRK
jgi:hypothetical protein